MRRIVILIVFLNFCFTISAQVESAREIIKILSSDSLAGRGYVKNGQEKAASYISEFLQAQGISSMLQEMQYPVNTFKDDIDLKAYSREIITKYEAGRDFLIHPASASIKISKKSIEQIPATSILENYKIQSKKVYGIEKTADNLAEINKLIDKFISTSAFKNSVLIIENYGKLIWSPAPRKSRNAVVYLTDSLEGDLLSANWKAEFKKEFNSANVIAKIPGLKSDSAFMFSAHYDHLGKLGDGAIFRGANDNASGVSMLLTLSAYFADNIPKYDTYFLFTTGEELGLLGSRYFIENPLVDLKKVKMLINLDMVGTGEEGITVVNAKKQQHFFQFLINNNNGGLAQIQSRGEACNSDHCFFDQVGVPAVFIYTLGGKQAYHDVNDDGEGLSLVAFNALQGLLIKYIESGK